MAKTATSAPGVIAAGPRVCRRKFLHYFPGGFRDPAYVAWERGYKQAAHAQWAESLSREAMRELLGSGDPTEVARFAVAIESRTHLLFSFEKMALRDAVKSPHAAEAFAEGLYALLHGRGRLEERFDAWCGAVDSLPRRQSRVLTWPVVTVFGFLGDPRTHFFFKPKVTRAAARAYGFDLPYEARPSWRIYRGVLEFAKTMRRDLADLRPRDMIDLQSFAWIQGSQEYE